MIGDLYIIAAPSGAGKTSLVNALVQQVEHLMLSVSYTTRPQRKGEQDGVNYHFVTDGQFDALMAEGAFLEEAHVFGYHYGTSKQWVDKQLSAGQDVILEIDWQGAAQIKRLYPNAISIFILPPSREALEHRLQTRGQDTPAVIAKRLANAHIDIAQAEHFDYWIINNDFTEALADLGSIIHSQRLKMPRQRLKQANLLAGYCGEGRGLL